MRFTSPCRPTVRRRLVRPDTRPPLALSHRRSGCCVAALAALLMVPPPPAKAAAPFSVDPGSGTSRPGVLTAKLTLASPPGIASGWRSPVAGPLRIVHDFSPPENRWGPGHRGVDLATRDGDVVRAAGDGVVLYAARLAGRGVVSVQHGALRTTYEPVDAVVHPGDHVGAGQQLGTVAAAGTHCAPASCLHWGLLRGEAYLDPLTLLGTGPSRLLPVWGVSPRPSLPATPRLTTGMPVRLP